MKYSTAPVLTGRGSYVRFVFRKKFIILFPSETDGSLRLCKLKRGSISVKGINEPNGDLRSLNNARPWEVKRENIDDGDFFDFEVILKKLPEKIEKRNAAIKKPFFYTRT